MKIFLDDVREPQNCLGYMHTRVGARNPIYADTSWYIVRNYNEFVKAIMKYYKVLEIVSFDHDLADGHYHKNLQEGAINYSSEDFNHNDNKTGYHCAMWMKEFYDHMGVPLPEIFIHSMNPVGVENIKAVFTNDNRRVG